jgi:hypothetical protein
MSARDVKARARALMCFSNRYCVGEGYFFFFLPVFFAFFAFLAFFAMLPSTIPKLVQCKSTSTRTNAKYTTITKLILRVLNKVNGGHAVTGCWWATSLTEHRRDTSTRLVARLS